MPGAIAIMLNAQDGHNDRLGLEKQKHAKFKEVSAANGDPCRFAFVSRFLLGFLGWPFVRSPMPPKPAEGNWRDGARLGSLPVGQMPTKAVPATYLNRSAFEHLFFQ
jgi:hypothetical protein